MEEKAKEEEQVTGGKVKLVPESTYFPLCSKRTFPTLEGTKLEDDLNLALSLFRPEDGIPDYISYMQVPECDSD